MRWPVILLVLVVGCDAATPDEPVAATLPIEVLGEPPVSARVELVVPAEVAASPDLVLELEVDNVVATDASLVQVNGGEPMDLAAAGALRPSGGSGLARLPLPAGSVHEGRNLLVFTYQRQIRDVSGFRVLAARIGSARLELPAEDPASWQPPVPAAIEAGRRFFTVESRDGGPACARCHADDGADLAYFAFSTPSIIARAEHHLFSREDATAIASYIRSLPVAPVGRVYDPPFQPGPAAHEAAGAGRQALADDVLAQAFPAGLPDAIPWDVAAALDPAIVTTSVAVPTWMRWLPRRLDDAWFQRDDGLLAHAEAALATGGLAEARAFQSAAIQIGKTIMIEEGDHDGRVQLLRYAAVKLWDWQRRHGGFAGADHGFPDGGPAFPYEVGFAFFEAASAEAVPDAAAQTLAWWMVQVAVNPGRGQGNGQRPLDWKDVLTAADLAGASAELIVYLHLIGSREDSLGLLADDFGSERGPVRLLAVPFRRAEPALATRLFARFLRREAAHLDGGGSLTPLHHATLADAWRAGCAALSSTQRSELRALAPAAVTGDLVACP